MTAKEVITQTKYYPSMPTRPEWPLIEQAMEEYRKQGNYFTPDEIAAIQTAAYEAGFNAHREA